MASYNDINYMNNAFTSHKIYEKQADGHEDKALMQQLESVFGGEAGQIVHDLFRRHTRADPFGVPPSPEHAIHEEFWDLHQDSRDVEGEKMVHDLAAIMNEVNARRQSQGQPVVKFTDPFFGPNLGSIFADESTAGQNAHMEQSDRRDLDPFLANMDVNTIQWKRPNELGDTSLDPVIYSGGIDPDDIGQGQLGNCYFLAAVQSCGVGDDDFLIKDLCIEDPDVSNCGMYGVKFYLNGKWITVLVDDLIPCTFNGQTWEPIFCKPMKHQKQNTREKELWALIFEKAWAKLNLSYEATDGGFTADTTNFLTGGSITKFEVDDSNWDALQKFTANDNHIAFLSCAIRQGLPEEPQLMGTWGLMNGHAYSILRFYEARNRQRFVHIRNPWGDGNEWKGRFSDKDKTSWTPELKQELNFQDQDDGSFWMLWDDFSYFFGDVEVCDPVAIARVTEGHHEHCRVDVFSSHWIRGRTAGGPESCKKTFKFNPVCTLRVDTTGPVEICLYQPDVRPVQALTDAQPLTVSLYLVDTQTGTRTELFESQKRCSCYKIEQAIAGRTYHLIAAAWSPGVESAFWITAAGCNATLDVAPEIMPNPEEEALLAMLTPRKTCCVVCHQDDPDGYYQTVEGYKCESCQRGNRKAAQGRGANPNRQISKQPATVANFSNDGSNNMRSMALGTQNKQNNFPPQQAQNSFGRNNMPNLMDGGGFGGNMPDVGLGNTGGNYADPGRLASGGGGGGGGYNDFATQGFPATPNQYSTIQTEDPRSPQMQCYYCDAPLFDKYKNTQYGPCCSPPCWEGRPAPKMEQQVMQRSAAPPVNQQPKQQEPEKICYYCEKKLGKNNFQQTQYGPSCKPGCWLGATGKATGNSSVMDNSFAPLNNSYFGGTSAVPYLNSSTLGTSATPYIAPSSFPAVGSTSPVYSAPFYGNFTPVSNVVPRFTGGPQFQPVSYPGQPPMMMSSAAGYTSQGYAPVGGSVSYAKPFVPINVPQYSSVPNSPAHSRRPSSHYFNPGPLMAAGGFGMQPSYGQPYY